MGYGKGPVIYGLDSCHRYRRKVPANRRTIAIAGMPNTGTNAMYKMLKNCNVSYRWQVPWKKHLPYHSSAEYDAKDLLPVVLIKDPLEWLASTCRKQYFKVRTGKSCPSPIINMSGTYFETATPETHKPFNNIVELWSNWHLEYLAAEVPLLMIRTEDLLFNPLDTLGAVCHCAGGTVASPDTFAVLESAPKWGKGHGTPSNRSEVLDRYTSERAALEQRLTEQDRETFHKFADAELMELFRYRLSSVNVSTPEPTAPVAPPAPCVVAPDSVLDSLSETEVIAMSSTLAGVTGAVFVAMALRWLWRCRHRRTELLPH